MMQLAIDESLRFQFADSPPNLWQVALVGGAILPYEGKRIWQSKQRLIKKGKSYKTEEEVCQVLDFLIECKVKGSLIIADVGYVSINESEIYRTDWLAPHFIYADSLEGILKESMLHHLNNLKKLHRQEFFKVLCILETITDFLQWITTNLNNIRMINLRDVKIIIDNQAKNSLITLEYFVHYFLRRRSEQNLFTCPENSKSKLAKYLSKDKTYLDTTKLFENILVGDSFKNEDKPSQVKIADLLSNISMRVLNGEFSLKVAKKLKKILFSTKTVCFDPYKDIHPKLPIKNREAIELLLSIKPLEKLPLIKNYKFKWIDLIKCYWGLKFNFTFKNL